MVIGQDTTSLPNGEHFNYCILEDSIDRKFLVSEDGCSSMSTILEKVELNDTILITIRLTDPKRFEQEVMNELHRGPPDAESIIFVVEGREILQIYQSDMLCNHHMYLTK